MTQKGIKLFSQIIPYYNINIEEYRPVTQCFKGYQYTHRTNQYKEIELICSKCADKGHTFQHCQSTTLKCLNCKGDHPAVSFKCPDKRNAQQQQNSPACPTQPNSSYAKAASSSTPPAPTPLPTSKAQNTTTTTDKQFLTNLIIKYSIELSCGVLKKQTELMNSLLSHNGCPTVSFPPNCFHENQEHFQQTQEQQQQTHANTHTSQTSTLPPPHSSPVSVASGGDAVTGDLVIDEEATAGDPVAGEDAASGEPQPLSHSPHSHRTHHHHSNYTPWYYSG